MPDERVKCTNTRITVFFASITHQAGPAVRYGTRDGSLFFGLRTAGRAGARTTATQTHGATETVVVWQGKSSQRHRQNFETVQRGRKSSKDNCRLLLSLSIRLPVEQ